MRERTARERETRESMCMHIFVCTVCAFVKVRKYEKTRNM